MNSLRNRLFAILVAATGVIWLSGVAWIYFSSRSQLEHVLDTRLQEAARMVGSLVAGGTMTGADAAASIGALSAEPASYERQLSCQIWSLDGRLVARSIGAPDARLTEAASGFSERTVDGESWRVYVIEDAAKGVRVMIGDRLGLRDQLATDLIKGLAVPALLILPLLAYLIWISVGRGLRPLRSMARELSQRGAEDMSPIDTGRTPTEVRPLTEALNGLFAKVEAARQHERDITAFAAHELRTPLAGLKTQAQIALATQEPAVRDGALRQIIVSVDRTARLVRQLLTLARLEATNPAPSGAPVMADEVLADIIAAAPLRPGIHVECDAALRGVALPGDRESLLLALGNLHENAIQHMPQGGTLSWRVVAAGHGLMVQDEGPGIPAEELGQVAQRFFRGRHRSANGTGLGLTIAKIAAERAGARLVLTNRTDRSGLQAALLWDEPS